MEVTEYIYHAFLISFVPRDTVLGYVICPKCRRGLYTLYIFTNGLNSFGHPAGWRKLCREHSPLFSASSLDLSGCLFLPQLLLNMHRQLLEMLHVLPKTAEGARGSWENANRKEWASNYRSGSVFQVTLAWRQHLTSHHKEGVHSL